MIRQRDQKLRHIADIIQRDNIGRHKLVRANTLTCPEHLPGRATVSIACKTCDGTGYTNGVRSDDINRAAAPYNTIYYIQGDIQLGHGLLGAGGRSEYANGEYGAQILGDAVFYFPANQRDPITGTPVTPIVALPGKDGSHPRPDRIIRAFDGQVFTLLHDLEESIGSSAFYKAFSLGIGYQGAGMPGMQR